MRGNAARSLLEGLESAFLGTTQNRQNLNRSIGRVRAKSERRAERSSCAGLAHHLSWERTCSCVLPVACSCPRGAVMSWGIPEARSSNAYLVRRQRAKYFSATCIAAKSSFDNARICIYTHRQCVQLDDNTFTLFRLVGTSLERGRTRPGLQLEILLFFLQRGSLPLISE